MTDTITICSDCLYKKKYNPCMVLTERGRLAAINRGTCGMKLNGTKLNKAQCK